MEPTYLGLSAVGWKVMLGSWWDKLVAGFLIASVALGSLYLLYCIFRAAAAYWHKRHQNPSIPSSVTRYIAKLGGNTTKLSVSKAPQGELKSFGVYLGSFENPPTESQAGLLSLWDVVVLDPSKLGVIDALTSEDSTSAHVVGRVDVQSLAKSDAASNGDEMIRTLDDLTKHIVNYFQSPFTGVLLANFQSHFQPAVINETAKFLRGLGLDVWLELSAPDYLTDRQAREINAKLIRGIIYRNGTIRTDGDRQNFFQMARMRTTMRAIAGQQVTHGPPQMMWETINDDADIQYAVVQRSYSWCRYSSCLLWIGHEAALTDAEAAATETVGQQPLGALMWLKDDDIVKVHDTWRNNEQISQSSLNHDAMYHSLHSFLPDLSTKLRLVPPQNIKKPSDEIDLVDYFNCGRETVKYVQSNPLSISTAGDAFTGLGCFQLGLEATPKNFEDVVQVQRNLLDLNLLQRLKGEEMQEIISRIRALHELQSMNPIYNSVASATKELINLLSTGQNNDDCYIQIYTGLHSGFQTSNKVQFFGLYDYDTAKNALQIYLSGKASDRASTVLHTFLSSRGCTRAECLMAELAMSEQTGSISKRWQLPPRVVHDLEGLSPEEMILFLKRLVPSTAEDDTVFLKRIRIFCKYQLIEMPTHTQLRAMSATAYLNGTLTAEELITARVSWLEGKGCWVPDLHEAISLFEAVDARLYEVLMRSESEVLGKLGIFVKEILHQNNIDASVDILALSIFSAFRKLALDEVYLEVLDRNPLPNHATDQAGCFAENFALGSRCDSFFDMTARDLGRIISDRYRIYYRKHQPPRVEDGFTELPTAYAAMQIDVDQNQGEEILPWYYHLTFLGIFAVPALVDVMLLTTIGRGLYLTTFMASYQKTMATSALMFALLVTGAIGSWIGSGGSYYFYASAFPAMNIFVLTRYVAGLAIALVGGIGAMIGIMIAKGVLPGLVFLYYFLMLTTYLLTLSTLSIYQLPGHRFQSGRSVIITCIPLLFVSPILTLWVKHDIIVYMGVLTIFLFSLLLGARRIISQWSTFYLNIPALTDVELLDWYTKKLGKKALNIAEGIDGEEIIPQARRAFHAAVLKDSNRYFWTRSTKDPLVAKMSAGYSSTMFLMNWFCRFKRTKMPLPYSTTWNLTVTAAIEMMTNMQKGLKLHSAFLHWRHTGADIWASLLYFFVALMDKWVSFFTGGGLVGLSAAASAEFHWSVGFGLCYYLIGAVSLDAVSLPLWRAANETTIQPITSVEFLRQATNNDKRARRALYWKNLTKFFFLHIWGLSITAALMWTFEVSRNATIMFAAYVGAYSGLLWYQYNKIFCGNRSGRSLGLASICGFPVGMALHFTLPNFPYSGVIGLAVGTWIAAFHSIIISKIGLPTIILSLFTNATADDQQYDFKTAPAVFSCGSLEPYPELSQKTLSQTLETIGAISGELRLKLDPAQHPGIRVMDILQSRKSAIRPQMIENAFTWADLLLDQIAELWKSGKIIVDIVSARDFPQFEQKLRTVSQMADGLLKVTIVLTSDGVAHEWTMDIHRNYKIIAEAIIQATCEHHLGFSHDHAMLAEILAVNESGDDDLPLPEGIKRQLETSPVERTRVINNGEKVLLRHLLLGVDCDTEWDDVPNNVRSFLLKRMCGQNVTVPSEVDLWITSRFSESNRLNTGEYIARSKLAATLTASIISYAKMLEEGNSYLIGGEETDFPDFGLETLVCSPPPASVNNTDSFVGRAHYAFSRLLQKVDKCIKFLVLALTADPEYQRELDYVMRGKVGLFRWPVTLFLNSVWSLCKALQGLIIPLVLFHDRKIVAKLGDNLKGMKTVIEKNRIVIESLSGTLTCFITTRPDGSFELFQYSGSHDEQPTDFKLLAAINNYSKKMVLLQRWEYRDGKVCNVFAYEYPTGKTRGLRLPMQRECIEGDLKDQIVQYDDRGYITMGSTFRGVNPVDFTYWYRKNAKFEDELLRGEYVLPHITIRVNWSMPPRNNADRMDNWIPFSRVAEATFVQGPDVYHATWDYEHKFHPDISTTLNGIPIITPPMIKEDWFHVLQKPDKCGFLSDNPLLSFSSPRSNIITRLLGLNKKRYLIPTSHARTQLWQTWKTSNELDAITARWLDERILRSDKILRKYWRNRDFGLHNTAKKYLDDHADTIMARVDVDQIISSWTHIAFKISDFYSFGQGGDSRINTRTLEGQLQDDYHELHVLAMDTSTWPNDPGGVSACRRDMVNDLKTIKWNIVAESANDYGVPKFQIEKNVQSLVILPLWGLDFLNPTHGILEGNLHSAVAQRSFETNTADIKKYFIPILTSIVKLARTRCLGRKHIEEATKALVDLNTYFETSRNWNDVWSSDIVKQTWRELWLTEMEDTLGVSEWWDFEKPTILELDNALNMWQRYLFIFSIPVPAKIPDVFQASHHFTGATYGLLCKAKRKCTLHIWDHCVSYRELTVFLSSGVSFDTPFVNSSLISLSHLACVLLEYHADVVLPCAEYFNPGWEIELGTSENLLEHRRIFARKIDPVVNGINNMEKFKPIEAIKTDKPTVVMLSHVQYPKDIKSAIMAVDFIVNKWGFKDYRLHIYGNKERMASYCTECQELIASKNLQEQCVLKGFGNPSVVLEDAWLFLNSSISEGLPLAMGEAALTGVPVVCTDVGASFCVVTDRETGAKFSEVVPPNDAEMLARAQINILALLGQWSTFADDAPGTEVPILSYPNPTPQDVERITERMYAKTEQRRAVGMLGRENVFKNFSADRYLREHEQMLWIGKQRSRSYNIQRSLAPASLSSTEWFSEKSMSSVDSLKKPRRKPRLTAESWTSLPRPVSLMSSPRPTSLVTV